MNKEKFIDLVKRWNIIISSHINAGKYDQFLYKLGYHSACYNYIDRNFADGLLMFMDWAKDKDFILSPKGKNGIIMFDKLDKILNYCMTVGFPENYHSFEQIRFTNKVYLQVGDENQIYLFYPNERDLTAQIDVTHTVDDLYNMVNKASLCNHGLPIKKMQKQVDFDYVYKNNNGGAYCRHKFDRESQEGLIKGNEYIPDIPLSFFCSSGGCSSGDTSSSAPILNRKEPNLGHIGVGFGDYFGDY